MDSRENKIQFDKNIHGQNKNFDQLSNNKDKNPSYKQNLKPFK